MISGLWHRPYFLLTLTALFWAGNLIIGKLIVGHVPPVTLSVVRWLGTFIIILPFAWSHLNRDWTIIRQHLWFFLGLSTLGFAIPAVLTYWSLHYTQALNVLLIQSSMPLFIALWALILFGNRLTKGQAIGIFTSLCGVAVILLRGDVTAITRVELNKGDLMFTLNCALFGLYSAAVSRAPKISQLSILTIMAGGCAVLLLPFAIWELSSTAVILDAASLSALAFLILFVTLLSYLFFNRGIQLIGPIRASPFFHLIPAFGSVMAILFLGEQLHAFHIVGYAAVMVGLYLASRRPAKAAVSAA